MTKLCSFVPSQPDLHAAYCSSTTRNQVATMQPYLTYFSNSILLTSSGLSPLTPATGAVEFTHASAIPISSRCTATYGFSLLLLLIILLLLLAFEPFAAAAALPMRCRKCRHCGR